LKHNHDEQSNENILMERKNGGENQFFPQSLEGSFGSTAQEMP
jgi:hypothetical protein